MLSKGKVRSCPEACKAQRGKKVFLIKDAFNMIQSIRQQEGFIGQWGGLLNIPQMIGGLIFIWAIEGQVILAIVFLTLMVAGQIHKRTPWSRLTGICHLPWLIMAPWLAHRIAAHEHGMILKAWLIYVAFTVTISLVFDVMDVWRYFRGERTFAWAAKARAAPLERH